MLPSSNYQSMAPYYYIALIISILTVTTIWLLVRSWVGLGLVAVREDEVGAAANGVPILWLKILAFAVSAFFMGTCGSLNAYYMFHIHPPGALSLNWGLLPILMTILGGSGTFLGPILGSFILAGIFEMANIWMPLLHPIFSGIFIVLVTLFLPRGIMSFLGAGGQPVIRKLFPFRASVSRKL
jgi:branched-chain amino acid transport system permease protein